MLFVICFGTSFKPSFRDVTSLLEQAPRLRHLSAATSA
jgi:hypothetical protein